MGKIYKLKNGEGVPDQQGGKLFSYLHSTLSTVRTSGPTFDAWADSGHGFRNQVNHTEKVRSEVFFGSGKGLLSGRMRCHGQRALR